MSKRSTHGPEREHPEKVRPHDVEFRKHNELNLFLDWLRQCNMIYWFELAYQKGNEYISCFDNDDWQALKNTLPSLSVEEKEKLVWCLYPNDPGHLMIMRELIHTDSAELFGRILVQLSAFDNPPFQLPEDSLTELFEKAMGFLQDGRYYEKEAFSRVYKIYESMIPESQRNRIPDPL